MINGCTDFEKNGKWLKISEINFLETVHQNWLKLLGKVTINHMHLPMKQVLKRMHRYGENGKMADGDGGQFLGNRAPELAETAQACFHHPCMIPHKMVFQMDAWFSS